MKVTKLRQIPRRADAIAMTQRDEPWMFAPHRTKIVDRNMKEELMRFLARGGAIQNPLGEEKIMVRKVLAMAALAGVLGAFSAGCSYGGVAVAPNGTVYVARNDAFLFGLLRGVYSCTPAGAELSCTKAGSP